MSEGYRVWGQTELPSSSLIVAWNRDISRMGAKVAHYLIQKLTGQRFAEIEPVDFFPLSGVTVENDVIQFPESRLYLCPQNALVILVSDPPTYKWYEFLSLILDIGQQHCRVKELYTLGGMVSLGAHTTPLGLVATFNSAELKVALSGYGLSADMDYETPADQRPTLNSFLLWTARRRNISAVSLWAPIPFYLLAVGDPRGQRRILRFFDQRFNLGLDFTDLDHEIKSQNVKIAQLRADLPEIDHFISRLEQNLVLSEEENEKLAKKMQEYIRGEEK